MNNIVCILEFNKIFDYNEDNFIVKYKIEKVNKLDYNLLLRNRKKIYLLQKSFF